MSDKSQSFIKSPRQLIVVVLLAFIIPIVVIMLITTYVQTTTRTGAGADAMTPEAIAERLQPVGQLVIADASAPSAAAPQQAAPAADAAAPPAAAAPAESAASEAAPKAAGAPDLAEGEKIYKGTCGVCHETGVAGAPRHGDKAAWKPRLEQGFEVLVKHSIEGLRAMPPRGGNGKLTDDELRDATGYMTASVQ